MSRHRATRAPWCRSSASSRPAVNALTSLAVLGAALLLTIGAAKPAHALPEPGLLGGDEFVERVRGGVVDAQGLTIVGDVDLRGIGRVQHLLACRDCSITGSLHAADVAFERVVDLSGLHLQGSLDLHGATFLDAFLLQRSEHREPFVAGATNLQTVTFAHRTAFDALEFRGPVDARSMTAQGDASFAEVLFISTADFARAQFQSTANLSGARFFDTARFDRADFDGPALLQQSQFAAPAMFRRVRFDAGADYTLAGFHDEAGFDRSTFGAPTSFRFVESREQLSLDQAHVLASLDFHTANLLNGISLRGVTTTGVLSLTGAVIGESQSLEGRDGPATPTSTVQLDPPPTAGLLMDVADTARIAGPRTQINALEVLEKTASAAGELSLANDARYRLLALNGQRHGVAGQVLDAVFYRAIAGYLVRPVHPLWWLAAALVVASSVRALAYWRVGRRQLAERADALTGLARFSRQAAPVAAAAVAAGVSDSVRRAVTRRGGVVEPPVLSPAAARALTFEVFVYRALTALTLIAIGNSSATVREVIDAIQG